jgi:hypothetical protein
MRPHFLLVSAVLLFCAGCAASPSPTANLTVGGPYVAMTAGETVTHGYSVGGPIANLDDTGTGFEALVGYEFSGILAAEASYVDLGNMKADGPAFGGFTDELKARGFGLSAVGTYPPSSPVAGQLRFGGFRWTQDIEYNNVSGDFVPVGDYVASEDGIGFSAGGGLRYRIPNLPGLGITASWTRFFKVGDPDKSRHSYDRDFFSGGVTYTFGSNPTE